MGLAEIVETVETIADRDDARRDTFRTELESFEAGDIERFTRTRELLAEERTQLRSLKEQLETEREELDELLDYTEFLSAEQAVRNREAVREKLEAHNRHLSSFHDAMTTAIDRIETNLDALEAGEENLPADPEPALETARTALREHNDAVEGLEGNIQILNAYLI